MKQANAFSSQGGSIVRKVVIGKRIKAGTGTVAGKTLRTDVLFHKNYSAELVHQVSDWCSGVAIKMGRRQGGPSRTGPKKEHIWIDT
jgi:hypothetical protein